MPVGGEPAAISNFFFTTRVSFLDIFHCTNFETTDTFFLDLNTAEINKKGYYSLPPKDERPLNLKKDL